MLFHRCCAPPTPVFDVAAACLMRIERRCCFPRARSSAKSACRTSRAMPAHFCRADAKRRKAWREKTMARKRAQAMTTRQSAEHHTACDPRRAHIRASCFCARRSRCPRSSASPVRPMRPGTRPAMPARLRNIFARRVCLPAPPPPLFRQQSVATTTVRLIAACCSGAVLLCQRRRF